MTVHLFSTLSSVSTGAYHVQISPSCHDSPPPAPRANLPVCLLCIIRMRSVATTVLKCHVQTVLTAFIVHGSHSCLGLVCFRLVCTLYFLPCTSLRLHLTYHIKPLWLVPATVRRQETLNFPATVYVLWMLVTFQPPALTFIAC